MWELSGFDAVSQSLCGVAELSQMHESDFPGSFVVVILSSGLLTNEKRAVREQKTAFNAMVEGMVQSAWAFTLDWLHFEDEVLILQ